MDSGYVRLALFGGDGADPAAIRAVVAGLPVYASRRFELDAGIEGFLDALPLMGRADVQRAFPQGFLRPGERFAEVVGSGKHQVVRTSGTSSDRLQVFWQGDWWDRQEEAALRANPVIAAVLAGDYTEAVLTTPHCAEHACQVGSSPMADRRLGHLLFLNTEHDPSTWSERDLARMADEIDAFRPAAMEADPAYLAMLARYHRRSGRKPPALGFLLLTYEMVTAIDRDVIAATFAGPIFELYGLTEAGVFFLEQPAGRLAFCGSASVVEVLRPAGANWPAGTGEIVLTTWGNGGTPLLRYRTGDLARVAGAELVAFEGRARDLIAAPGGAVTPRAIDEALAATPGLERYRVMQTGTSSVTVEYVGELGHSLADRLAGLWPAWTCTETRVPFLAPEMSGKYRTVVPL